MNLERAAPASSAISSKDWPLVTRFMKRNGIGPPHTEGLIRFIQLGPRPIQEELLVAPDFDTSRAIAGFERHVSVTADGYRRLLQEKA